MNFTETTINGIRTLTAKQKFDCEHLLNEWMTDEHFDIVIDDDCDMYAPPLASLGGTENNEDNLGFRFRKNYFTQEEMDGAYEGLVGAALPTNNRGTSTGEIGLGKQGNRDWVYPWQFEIMELIEKGTIDGTTPQDIMDRYAAKYGSLDFHSEKRGFLWHRGRVEKTHSYDNFFMTQLEEGLTPEKVKWMKTLIPDTGYTNSILSGIAGFYDRYPRIPFGRATNYTESNFEKFKLCYPYMRKLNTLFAELVPGRYAKQKAVAEKIDPRFIVAEDTAFSTITVNKNYRTTAHRDGANFQGGFSNLSTVSRAGASWTGGLFVLPEYRIAINLRPGDALLVDNCGIIHGNTEMFPPEGKDMDDLERISMVSYMRDGMEALGSKEYEDARREYVTERSRNKDHKLWVERWNGVSPGMWTEQEWFDFLESKGLTDEDGNLPPTDNKPSTLDAFF